jgi:CheY-like chemotaxis protein
MPRVLFLEDEEDLVEYLPRLLKEKALEVTGTVFIDEALERFAKEDFDVVLLDIMMAPAADMDAEELDYGRETGVEVARRMKAIKPDVPIVALTVLTDSKIRAEMREAGIVEILNKPSEPEQIADFLWQVIRVRSRRRS